MSSEEKSTYAWAYQKPYIVVEKLRENRSGGYPLQYYSPSFLEKLNIGDEILITPADSEYVKWVEVSVKRDCKPVGSAGIRLQHVDNVFLLGYKNDATCEHFRIVPEVDAEAILAGVPPEDIYV